MTCAKWKREVPFAASDGGQSWIRQSSMLEVTFRMSGMVVGQALDRVLNGAEALCKHILLDLKSRYHIKPS
jgi:hypothetical protein